MFYYISLIFFVTLFQICIQQDLLKNTTESNSTDTVKANDTLLANTRRSNGLLNILPGPDGKVVSGVTSHKVETKTFTTHVSKVGSTGGLDGQVLEHNKAAVALNPHVPSIVRSESHTFNHHGQVALNSKPQVQSIVHSSSHASGHNGWISGQNAGTVPLQPQIQGIYGSQTNSQGWVSGQNGLNPQIQSQSSSGLILGQNQGAMSPQIQGTSHSSGLILGQNQGAMSPQIQGTRHSSSQFSQRWVSGQNGATMTVGPGIQKINHGKQSSGPGWVLGQNGATMALYPQMQTISHGGGQSSSQGWVSGQNIGLHSNPQIQSIQGGSQSTTHHGWASSQNEGMLGPKPQNQGIAYDGSRNYSLRDGMQVHNTPSGLHGLFSSQNKATMVMTPQIEGMVQPTAKWDSRSNVANSNLNLQGFVQESILPPSWDSSIPTTDQKWASNQNDLFINPGVMPGQTILHQIVSSYPLTSSVNGWYNQNTPVVRLQPNTCMLPQPGATSNIIAAPGLSRIEQFYNPRPYYNVPESFPPQIDQLTKSGVVNDITGGIGTGQAMGTVNNLENGYHPVTISGGNDGIYANELRGQQGQILNKVIPTNTNMQYIMAVPVMNPQFGQIQGYIPNLQYYLRQPELGYLLKKSLSSHVPPFLDHINSDLRSSIQLSEDQLNSYKQYLIRTGLINLQPFQLMFSDQFRPKLRDMPWSVVTLRPDSGFCQNCHKIFRRNALFSNIIPLKLLVPVLKNGNGFQKSITAAETVADGLGDVTKDVVHKISDLPSQLNKNKDKAASSEESES